MSLVTPIYCSPSVGHFVGGGPIQPAERSIARACQSENTNGLLFVFESIRRALPPQNDVPGILNKCPIHSDVCFCRQNAPVASPTACRLRAVMIGGDSQEGFAHTGGAGREHVTDYECGVMLSPSTAVPDVSYGMHVGPYPPKSRAFNDVFACLACFRHKRAIMVLAQGLQVCAQPYSSSLLNFHGVVYFADWSMVTSPLST